MSTPKPKVTNEETLYLKLKDSIRTGTALPGTRLMEADLVKAYDTSRAVVRTVLRRLEAEGLVKIDPYKGARVPALTLEELVSLLDIREVLEGLAARRASERITDEGATELHDVLARMEAAYKAIDVFEWSDLNAELHLLITTIAQSERLQGIIEAMIVPTVRYAMVSVLTASRMSKSHAEHCRLVGAICARDPDAAERAAREHVATVKRNLLNTDRDRLPMLC